MLIAFAYVKSLRIRRRRMGARVHKVKLWMDGRGSGDGRKWKEWRTTMEIILR